MDNLLQSKLPVGIIVNTANIYMEVAEFPTVPIHKVSEYWHVYTTTNKKLQDPTAHRLENFWWHVWGSNRRFLSGRALARLFEDISLGPTFMPLRGPPDRWEGPDVCSDGVRLALTGAALTPQDSSSNGQTPDTCEQPQSEPAQEPTPPRKKLSSSASKPPPKHPILKKERISSSTGPRPTARFAFPKPEVDEDEAVSDSQSSATSSTAAATGSRLAVQSPARKGKNVAPRKVVATSRGSKKRPILSRRQSAQSSTASESSAREVGASSASRAPPISRTVSPIPEVISNRESPRSLKEALVIPPGITVKAAGKQPALRRAPLNENNTSLPLPDISAKFDGSSSTDTLVNSESGQAKPPSSRPGHARATSAFARSAVTRESTDPSHAPPAMVRSQSLTSSDHLKTSSGPTTSHALFATMPTASTSNVAVQGTIVDQSGLYSLPSQGNDFNPGDLHVLPSRPSAASLFESRFTPTQPGPSESLPLARSKSQLTLLLEREKERMGDRSRPKR